MQKNLILTGGINHDFVDTADAIAEVLAEENIESIVTDDLSDGFAQLDKADFDLVTVFTLRWRMLDDDKYIPHRTEWAYEINERDRQLLTAHIARGGGLLGLHTASICFDTWPEWPALLGAEWVWQQTFHPPPAVLHVIFISTYMPDSCPCCIYLTRVISTCSLLYIRLVKVSI